MCSPLVPRVRDVATGAGSLADYVQLLRSTEQRSSGSERSGTATPQTGWSCNGRLRQHSASEALHGLLNIVKQGPSALCHSSAPLAVMIFAVRPHVLGGVHVLRDFCGQQKGAKCGDASPCRCLAMDATDARAHVALGKLLVQQRRWEEARAIYEEGSTATGGQPAVMTGDQHAGPRTIRQSAQGHSAAWQLCRHRQQC